MTLNFGEGQGIYHNEALALNSARSALKLFIKNSNYEKYLIPFFLCKDVKDIFIQNKINFEFYSLDNNLKPILSNSISERYCILYVNYFGIFDSFCDEITNTFKSIILDCSQSFFYKPKTNISALYSPRKFYGLPDGGFLVTNRKIKHNLQFSHSSNKLRHLLSKFELNESEAFRLYQENEESFKNEKIKLMSKLTYSLLSAQNHDKTINKRKSNFSIYHNAFKKSNKLKDLIKIESFKCAISYPLLINDGINIRKYLINNKVYTPTYWKTSNKPKAIDCFMSNISQNIIHLPIDQRYDSDSILRIIELIKKYQ